MGLGDLKEVTNLTYNYVLSGFQGDNPILLKTTGPDALLHGDLHHDNILQNGNDWLVIDPKGVIGSPMNEIWAFVMDIERDIPFIARYFNFRTQDVFSWYFVHII